CFDNLSNIELNLKSNYFSNNKAINGGALYIEEGEHIDNNINKTINIENNIFKNNIAEDFGGAIYSDIQKLNLAITNSNEFSFNEAGVMVNLQEENISSKPKYIILDNKKSLSVIAGDYLSISFTLLDTLNNVVSDLNNYFSLTLKLILEMNEIDNNNDNNNNNNNNYFMKGNIGSFVHGKCEFNNLQVYANPGTYNIKVVVENYNDEILFNFDSIDIKIMECNDNHIKIIDKNNILQCKNPICNSSCPVGVSATCVPGKNNTNNDISLNNCVCNDGWMGDNCDIKIYIDFNNFFATYESYTECSLYFLIKHIGVLVILAILLIYITLAYELGVLNETDKKFKFVKSISLSSMSSSENETSIDNIHTKQSGTTLGGSLSGVSGVSGVFSGSNNNVKSNSDVDSMEILSQKIFGSQTLNHEKKKKHKGKKSVRRSVKNARSLDIMEPEEIISKENIVNSYSQDQNGNWYYKCPLEKPNLTYDIIELLLFIVIIIKGRYVNKCKCIFKCNKFILYSSSVGIVFGPVVNILSIELYRNQIYERTVFGILLNTICYMVIFLAFSWDKIYYVVTHNGNNYCKYFIWDMKEKCIIHKSYTCGCHLENSKENTYFSINIVRK
ncbi:hypothetical protein PIROE2DRAFT_10070, partial [Piromyces sp. E2]